MIVDYARPVYQQGLRDELLAAGFPVQAVHGDGRVVLDDTAPFDRAALDAAVAAHNPAKYDQAAHDARTAYDDAVAFLKTFRKQTPGTATNAQRDHAIQSLIDVAKAQNADLRELQGG